MKRLISFLLLSLLFVQAAYAAKPDAPLSQRPDVLKFISKMVSKHGFNQTKLITLFDHVEISQRVIDLIRRPYEAQPWYIYRKHFLNKKRIDGGVTFWQRHAADLKKASKRFGVPASIIVAIIGVESHYGTRQGSFSVLQALSTLAFDYPKRAKFFRKELMHFLILCREQGWDPRTIKGSYAGAMGQGQFMPSSYRAYAIDFTSNGHIDLFNNAADMIGSVANYMAKHGWHRDEAIVIPAKVKGKRYEQALLGQNKPLYSFKDLTQYGISPVIKKNLTNKAMFFEVETSALKKQYWLGLHNFYVITRYNTSKLYALAVAQLAETIEKAYKARTK